MKYMYLDLLEKKQLTPNFWCSSEYFEKAGFIEYSYLGQIEIRDEDNDLIFPVLDTSNNVAFVMKQEPVWADFPCKFSAPIKELTTTFLDWNYIFDPKAFKEMAGKKWQTFRKNCRKYPNRLNEGESLCYVTAEQFQNYWPDKAGDAYGRFVEQWAEGIKWDSIEDGEVMSRYIVDGENRSILVDQDGAVRGVNIWDENYSMINYRYCLCLDQPFLSEYMRYRFYLSMVNRDKLINDGGVLGDPNLKSFKDKMNPLRIEKIQSWNFKK